MASKVYISIFLLTIGCNFIQNEEQAYQNFNMWPKNSDMIQVKESKATFVEEYLPIFNGSVPVEQGEHVALEEMQKMHSEPDKMEKNRIKRELEYEDDDSQSSSLEETENSKEDSEEANEVQKPQFKQEDGSKGVKRQTSIIGNGNRLSNLVNLPLRLNVLANVLSKLNQGVLDSKEKSPGSNTIIGNDNTVSSLVNAPIDADAVVNLLSKIDRTKPGLGDTQDGVVNGLLGGLLAGGSGRANKGLVGGLLNGLLGDNDGSGLLGDVLGDTLGDLLGALLGGNGLVGNLLGGVDGKGLVAELLDDLLGGVVELVDHLLDLLVGLLDGLLLGLKDSPKSASIADQTADSNIAVSSLASAPNRVKTLINALTSLKQQLRQQQNPAASHGLPNLTIDPKHKAAAISPASSSTGSSLLGSLLGTPSNAISSPGSSSSTANGDTNIQGDNNSLSSLLNVVPDVNLNLNLLSQITDLLVGNGGSNVGAKGGAVEGSNPNEICFDIPISQSDTSITGNNNKVTNTINVKPKINLDLNLLSKVTGSGGSNQPTQRVCITKPAQPLVKAALPPAPLSQASFPTVPIPPAPLPAALHPPAPIPTAPRISAPRAPASIPPLSHLPTPSLSTPILPAQHMTSPFLPPPLLPSQLLPAPYNPTLPIASPPIPFRPLPAPVGPPKVNCFNVLVDQSGAIVNGNNNKVSSLLNLDPSINLDLNLLSDVHETNPQVNFMTKTICIPDPTATIPAPIFPPAGIPSNTALDESNCFRRTCARWKQFVDYN